MRWRRAVLAAALLRGLAAHAGDAGWHSIGPDGTADLRALHEVSGSSGVVLAGTGNGIFRSVSGGAFWRHVGPPDRTPVAFASPQSPGGVVYALMSSGHSHGTLFRSDDAGVSWRFQSDTLAGLLPSALGVDADNPDVVYVGGSGSIDVDISPGLFRSVDAGHTWHALGVPGVRTIHVAPSEHGVVIADTWWGPRVSRDGGKTWVSSGNPACTLFIGPLVVSPHRSSVMARACWEGLMLTRNGGRSWATMAAAQPGFHPSRVRFDPRHEHALYATAWHSLEDSEARVYRSVDHGVSWSPIGPPLENLRWDVDPLVTHDGRVYAAAGGGLLTTSTAASKAAAWTHATRGLTARPVAALAIDPKGSLYALERGRVLERNGCGWDTTLGLNPWQLQQVAVAPSRPSILYALAAGWAGSYLFSSADAGGSWTIYETPGLASAIGVDAIDPAVVYVGTQGDWDQRAVATIYKSMYRGSGWRRAVVELPQHGDYDTSIIAIVPDRGSSDRVYAITNNQGILRSEDGGARFLPLPDWPFYDRFIHTLAVDALDSNVLVVGGERGLYRSKDTGLTWDVVLSGETVGQIAADSWQGRTTWYAFTYPPDPWGGQPPLEERGPGRLIRSVGDERTWQTVYPEFPGDGVFALAIRPGDRGTLFAASRGRGVLALPLRGIDTTDAVCALDPAVIDALSCSSNATIVRRTRRRVARARELLRSVESLPAVEAVSVVARSSRLLEREMRIVAGAAHRRRGARSCARALEDFLRNALEFSWPMPTADAR